jgi:hypothetical protein
MTIDLANLEDELEMAQNALGERRKELEDARSNYNLAERKVRQVNALIALEQSPAVPQEES